MGSHSTNPDRQGATDLKGRRALQGWFAGIVLTLGLITACSGSSYRVSELGDAGQPDATSSDDPDFPVTGIGSKTLRVTGIEPSSGPFSGGTRAVVRGSGFKKGATVRIGGRSVEPSSIVLDGSGRLEVIVPAGDVGDADVQVDLGDERARLDDAFHYNALQLIPEQGSIAGGTLIEVTVSGGELDATSVIELDGQACTDVRALGTKRVRCKTPKHIAGRVDVTAHALGDVSALYTAEGGFEYIDTGDTDRGGLSGGSVDGTLNVTVVDSGAGRLIPGAFVLVGNDPKGKYQGLTDERGSITFSGADLVGPVTVHASMKCFERSSIVSFDAQNATLFLSPILDFSCADDGEPGTGHGVLGSYVSGELLFPGSDEFNFNHWDIVPKPKAGEVRVAYVFTTRASADNENPPADIEGTMARIEESGAMLGDRGAVYRIFARPAGLAVYALVGLERVSDGKFTAYAMGVARNVVTSPGDESTKVDIEVNITLDRELSVAMSGLPDNAATGAQSEYRVRAVVDLGGEGVIARELPFGSLDTITRYGAGDGFRFLAQPAFVGTLQDASYEVVAGYYTRGQDYPYTSLRRLGVMQSSAPLSLDGFLGIAQVVSPKNGARIPADRVLRFSLPKNAEEPDLFVVEVIGGDGNPAWRQILPGAARSVPLPDLSSIEDQVDIAEGTLDWSVTALSLDDFEYDSFHYSQLSDRYVTHSSQNVFQARR